MRTQNRIRLLLILTFVIGFVFLLTAMLYFNQKSNDIIDSHNINSIRAYTTPIINLIEEDYPYIDEVELNTRLDELDTTALVSDLQNTVFYNNTTIDSDDVVHVLYQDQSYSFKHDGLIKVSFPLMDDSTVVGLVLFEIPQSKLIESNYTVYIFVIISEVILMILAIIGLIIEFRKTVCNPLRKLERALLDVSNGVYNKLASGKGISERSFTHFNIMLDELENRISTQADYAKSRKQLIADISHEIRTPLSYVKISAEILESECNNPETKKYITTILQKIALIDGIIEDLFRYSRQDLDKLLVELKDTYAKDMFEKIFKSIEKKDKSKSINYKLENQVPNVLINVDANRIEQVISNMVDNAEKHIHKDGFIRLQTMIDENHLVLIIEDSGEGIEPKDLPYIFEPFYQGSQDDAIKRKGAGLGLSICDYIIKKHNGDIFVYSEKGKGTKFIIKFPEIE